MYDSRRKSRWVILNDFTSLYLIKSKVWHFIFFPFWFLLWLVATHWSIAIVVFILFILANF
jgi:hypothetical protein